MSTKVCAPLFCDCALNHIWGVQSLVITEQEWPSPNKKSSEEARLFKNPINSTKKIPHDPVQKWPFIPVKYYLQQKRPLDPSDSL